MIRMGSTKKYILAVDQSTSATKAIIFGREGRVVDRCTLAHRQFYPSPGFAEHDPSEIFENTCRAIGQVISANQVEASELASVAITNQRETALIWDKESGLPVANAAVWQCQRGAGYCAELREKGVEPMISEKTGLIIDPYFSASKLHWIMNHQPGLREKAESGKLLWGTIDTWLLWKLTGGRVHATDFSNACRTLLFNIKTLDWDDELIELFDLHRTMFPEVRFSDEIFGNTDPEIIFNIPVPISGIIGDSHAALFGQNCFTPGMGKATYGTGSSLMMNIGEHPEDPPEGLVTSIGYGFEKRVFYVFEGNIHSTGDTINWLKNELQLIERADDTEELAASVDDNNGVYFVPAFAGLGAPYWDNSARACLSGISRNATRAHVVRAALESIAYQIKDLIVLMETRGEIRLQELRVDGGPTRNNFLMQFQADMLNRPVIRSGIEEVSALGAAFIAGLATGFWKNLEEITGLRQTDLTFQPGMDPAVISRLYNGWKKAVDRARL
jgi:glycerol kinase